MADYKTSKEAFVSGMTGSSIGHINMVSLAALSSIALHSALRTRLPASKSIHFPTEVLILVLPLLLSVTLFADTPGLLSLILLFPTGLLLLIPARESGTPLPSSLSPCRVPSPSRERDGSSTPTREAGNEQLPAVPPLPALTTYRAHMLLLTFICILAVDFPVFPRSLAKCETFGVSMMDLGVGSFVYSQGIVSAIPLIKDPAYLSAPWLPKFRSVLRKCLPVLMLGVLRTISIKGTEYPEHETEYGTHWNFFFTLAFIPLLEVVLHPLIVHVPISLLGVVVAILHQISLSLLGLMSFIFEAPRVSLISANKEGLISLTGYLSIHLLGLSTGTLVLPPTPSYFRRHQHQLVQVDSVKADTDSSSDSEADGDTTNRRESIRRVHLYQKRENDKTAIELCSYAVVWWVLLGVMTWLNTGGGISRRLVNLQYIIWVAAYNTSFLLGYLLLDLLFFASPLSKSMYSPTSKLKVHPDAEFLSQRDNRRYDIVRGAATLLEAVNRNGLALFLLANVATGLINLSIPTMYASDWAAMLVLFMYAVGLCSVAWIFKDRKLWKF
ncbi:GWT1-domain-containing protein [Obba rivulosa]|uniref:GPI-anchored wall transfer protein n=1 Tax=Obba rivulosa TaxID=1052685 RepID=A0A8E2ALC2_9APHY|nr:GWT1-domain-containing protein [Obba rivulosa]